MLEAFYWNGLSPLLGRAPPRLRGRRGGRPRAARRRSRSPGSRCTTRSWVAALVGLWRLRRRRTLVIPLLAMALAASIVFTVASATRYRAPLEPLLAILAVAAVAPVAPGPRRRRHPAGPRMTAPAISVVVATRDRPERLGRPARQPAGADARRAVRGRRRRRRRRGADGGGDSTREARRPRPDSSCAPAAAGPAAARNLGWRAASGALDRVHRRRLRGARRAGSRPRSRRRGRTPGRSCRARRLPIPRRARPPRAVRAHALDRRARGPWFETCNIVYEAGLLERLGRLRRGVRRGAGRGHRPRLAGARARRRARLGRRGAGPSRRRRARSAGHRPRGARRQRLGARLRPPSRAAGRARCAGAWSATRACRGWGWRSPAWRSPAAAGPRLLLAPPLRARPRRSAAATSAPARSRRRYTSPPTSPPLDLAARLGSPPPAGALMAVAVIGAGAAGLACARRLAEAGVECDVYERWPGLGGQAATIDVGDGVRIERYYHYLFTSDSIAIDAFEQLGLGDALGQLPVERRVRDRRADLALQRRRATCCASARCRSPARLRMGLRAAAAAARAPRDRATTSARRRARGSGATWATRPGSASGAR